MNGMGRYEWPDGKFYEGQFVNDKMHGKGVYNYGDGNLYKGEFQND